MHCQSIKPHRASNLVAKMSTGTVIIEGAMLRLIEKVIAEPYLGGRKSEICLHTPCVAS